MQRSVDVSRGLSALVKPVEEITKKIEGYTRLRDLVARGMTVCPPNARISSTQKRELSEGEITSETPSQHNFP